MATPNTPTAFTEREMRMLLSLLEAETKNAELVSRKWHETPDEGYPDGPDALDTERTFARGYETGWKAAENLIRRVLNA